MSILVLGGARSGKSRYAESLAKNHKKVTYIATAVAVDEEIKQRIDRHKSDRPRNWRTIEEPINLAQALAQASRESDCILIDCLTFWANNCLYESEQTWAQQKKLFIKAVTENACDLILVSNEVGMGITPIGVESRVFVDQIGWLHQDLAQIAETVILVVAGIPQNIKGHTINVDK